MATSALEQSTEPTPDQRQVNGNCLSAGGPIRLNLGGIGDGKTENIPGFTIVDLSDDPRVGLRCDVGDLKGIPDNVVSEIYASNILEHFPHLRTLHVLKEWRRVLKKGAVLWISVPDMDSLVRLFQRFGLTEYVKNMIWGDQIHPYAFHYVTFTFASLAKAVIDAGFSDIVRIKEFPFGLRDCSVHVDTCEGKPVSLNVKVIA